MKEQIICIICIILNGIISVINGQPQPPFTNFAQGPLQGQGNPALFQQFLQNRQAAAGTGGIPPATGFGTQTGQIRTVTVPVLPGPGDDAGFGQGDGQFGAQTGVGGFQSDGPIPRFAQGVAGIGQPFTQFGPQGLATQGRTGFGNAGVITARQRQLAIMRRNSQAQAQRQAAAAGATSGTGPDTPALGPFSRMGLGENSQMLVLSNSALNDIQAGRNIGRREIITRTNNGRPATLLSAFALQSNIFDGSRDRQPIQNGGQRQVSVQQTARTTEFRTVPSGQATLNRNVQSLATAGQLRNSVSSAQGRSTAGQRVNGAAFRTGGVTTITNGSERTNGATQRQTVTIQRTTLGANGQQAQQDGMMRPQFSPFMTGFPSPFTDQQIAAQEQMMMQQNPNIPTPLMTGFPSPFGDPQTAAAQNQLMMQQAPDMNNPFMTGMPMPFADQQAGADQNPMATQQALARIRAAGGLPPFAFMGAPAMPGAIPSFGMFPGGRPRPPMSANGTETAGSASALWRPDLRMPGMIMPPPVGAGLSPFPGMFAPGFLPGAANRIVGSANGAAAGFTGDSNALFPNEPILNPRDPRIGIMPNIGNLQVFGSQQRPFPRVQAPGNNQGAGSPQRRFPLAPGGAAAQAASNQLNLVSSATRTRTNILTPPAVIPANVAAFPGPSNNPTARVPQNIAAFPGSESNAVTVTETKTITKNTPTMIAAFPGADHIGASDSSSKSVAVADVPAFPGMEIGNSISAAKMSSSDLQTFPAVGVTSTKSKTSSGLPVSFSLTIQGAEKPFGPGEVPPPPPVFPAKDIDNIPASVDASLFGSGSSNAWTKISGEALSSSSAGSTSSSNGTTDSGSVSGRSTSTVAVRKSESSNSLTTNLQSDLPSFPGSEMGSTVRTEGENVSAPVATVPPGSAGMFPAARSSLPDFPGLDSSVDAGGVPSKS